ncbi:hypothetical protein F5Y00DRAFT_255798 [Daldinia vernicosa]|uniref:uncharacterized protein n=1 Tax=Daldinia vernicosa TaxID=114800 RepID=UPI002008BFB0|nr:uncharacterized protein F5Y00DRAFT_255798 [Daldinia vernicosa]KAI0844754.1 hypothetical protein F5Y00DRAFT_255798 [Daldinia vernicosa]
MAPYTPSMRFPTAVLVVNSVGLAISFAAVGLRFWSRSMRRAKVRLSDYTIVVSWIFALGLVISENYIVTKGGIGQSSADASLEELLFSNKQFLVIIICGTLAVTFVKISILDFLLSVFATNNVFRIADYTLMAITSAYGISFTIVTLAGCRPFEANWDKLSYPDYQCINTSHFYVAQTAIGAVLDCLILLLPVPVVWTLSMKTSKKVALTFLFTIGILICAISFVRLATQLEYMLTHFTKYGGIATLLGALEANLSIVCACLPAMPQLLTSFAEKIKMSLGSEDGGLRGLFSTFSFGYRRNTHGSVKLSEASDKQGNVSSVNDDVEKARVQKQMDKLYPLSMTGASRGSFDEERAWTQQVGRTYARVNTANSGHSEEPVEMTRLGENVEPYSTINVTKSWRVN